MVKAIVTSEEIREMPRRYAIGKRPLSRLLGWGELTYTRLLEGRTPSREHSEELRRLIDDPSAFMWLLERGHDAGTITDVAYQRSKRALDAILEEISVSNGTQIFGVADRLCVLSKGDITPHALQVLTYYVHGYSASLIDEPLFNRQPLAADDGPMYEQIRDGYTHADILAAASRGSSSARPDTALAPEVARLVDAVYEKYQDYSGAALARMACSESPWRKARKRAESSALEPITQKSLKKYFSKNAPLGKS